MRKKNIQDIVSYNQGVQDALDVLKQQFYTGNLDGNHPVIALVEGLLAPIENGVYAEFIEIPESVEERTVETKNLLESEGGE